MLKRRISHLRHKMIEALVTSTFAVTGKLYSIIEEKIMHSVTDVAIDIDESLDDD